jgi:plasmid replication initiation protein
MKKDNQSVVEFINPGKSQMPRILNRSVHKFNSVTAKRIFYAVQSQLKKHMNDPQAYDIAPSGDVFYNIPTSLITDSQHFSAIEKAANELMNIRFQFIDPENEKFSKMTPFPVVLYEKRWGAIKVNVLPMAMPFLAELNKGYYWWWLESALSLSSKYSQRWYDLLAEKKDIGKLQMTIDNIRLLMDLTNEFSNVSNLLRKVVYNPIQEINEKTEMYISYQPIDNQKRPILGFDFTITSQDKQNRLLIKEKQKKYFDDFSSLSPQEQSIRISCILKEYNLGTGMFDGYNIFEPEILNAVLETDVAIKAGKTVIMKTPGKYMAGVIKNAVKAIHNRNAPLSNNTREPSDSMKEFLASTSNSKKK